MGPLRPFASLTPATSRLAFGSHGQTLDLMTTTIQFYHLLSTSAERAVPKLMEKALDGKSRVVMLLPDDAALARMSEALWTSNPNGFLPHGGAKDGRAADQPIYLCTEDTNPNRADILCVLGGASPASMGDYAKVLDVFDGGNEEHVLRARQRWTAYKEAGHKLQYIKQQESGGWKIEAESDAA